MITGNGSKQSHNSYEIVFDRILDCWSPFMKSSDEVELESMDHGSISYSNSRE